jgi:alkaline phosphatase
LYLEPLLEQMELNDGRVWPGEGKLQFMIEIKSQSDATLRALEKVLKPFRSYFDTEQNPDAVRLAITGNVPSPSKFTDYDTIFFFDGRAEVRYTDEQLARVAFFSAPLDKFTKWRGRRNLPEYDRREIEAFIDYIHGKGKKVRFWGNPDTRLCWQTFIELGVDYINTDNPSGLALFLNEFRIFVSY